MTLHAVSVTIQDPPSDNKRAVLFNDEPSHHVDESVVQSLLDDAANADWYSSEAQGRDLGKRLFDLLDGSGGRLKKACDEAQARRAALVINLNVPAALDTLPFELLFNQRFLLIDGSTHLVRRVNSRGRGERYSPRNRLLRTLFMACSPSDLPPKSVLPFEREEELILAKVEHCPMDLEFEDTGSVEGLRQSLTEGVLPE